MKTLTSDKVDWGVGDLGPVLGLVTNALCDPGQVSLSSSLAAGCTVWHLPGVHGAGSHGSSSTSVKTRPLLL